MTENEPEREQERQSKREVVGSFFKDQALKGKLLIQQSLGLGAQPNVIPPSEASVSGDLRVVQIGWHPVAGLGGKWFAEQTGLGKMITKKINHYPDPTQHWAVLVEDYVHQLWMDEHLDIIYINERLKPAEWHTFVVGKTRFNDEALRQASEMTIHQMRTKRPAYNLISNNCQNFALELLNAIQIGAHRQFASAFAIYQRATGKGSIEDLFVDKHPEEQQQNEVEEQETDDLNRPPRLQHTSAMQTAQQVMDEQTTKLDRHHHSSPD
ncbi:uncharacterized protein PV07_05959 [Cladophialophora immunda]|uniref:PPPDE domain-containing protein n=1 Tax=Cladophialophora immunda TaxID=569365 RepID=A0A0D2D3A4_9EURO|nr:uncharacterized protein PV07_05959 [Cladophialophora immunda]KIW30199.1 hypothetical protein PV07_05959 [Cladophialophora immunda]